MPNNLAQRKINQQSNHTQVHRHLMPKSLVLKPRTMGSHTRENGHFLIQNNMPKYKSTLTEQSLFTGDESWNPHGFLDVETMLQILVSWTVMKTKIVSHITRLELPKRFSWIHMMKISQAYTMYLDRKITRKWNAWKNTLICTWELDSARTEFWHQSFIPLMINIVKRSNTQFMRP